MVDRRAVGADIEGNILKHFTNSQSAGVWDEDVGVHRFILTDLEAGSLRRSDLTNRVLPLYDFNRLFDFLLAQ